MRTWGLHDYTLAVALQMYEDDLDPGCGHSMTEAATNLYDAPPPTRCMACDAIEQRTTDYEKAIRPGALRFGAVKRPQREAKSSTDQLG